MMSRLVRVLVLEDDPLVSLDIDSIVSGAVPSIVEMSTSVAEAIRVLDEPVDLALLDIDVRDGKSYPIAALLWRWGTPFIFVSASPHRDVPSPLGAAPFVAKPFSARTLEAAVLASLGRA
jgi:DNA-binding response OmpR family regulator